MDAKASVRARVLAARDALSANVRAEKSARICRELERLLDEAMAVRASSLQSGGSQPNASCFDAARPGAARPSTPHHGEPGQGAPGHDGLRAGAPRHDGPGQGAAQQPNAPRFGAPAAKRPVVTAFSCMGSEVDVAPFVRAAFARGALVAYPCMVKNPAWAKPPTRGAAGGPTGADEPARSHGEAARVPGQVGAGCDTTEGEGCGRERASFVPRLLMQFRAVSRAQFEAGTAPFVAKPLRSFAPDDPELAAFPLVEPEQVDVAVCPLVAFDAAGNRLGYGGGNYDGFLARVRPDALVAGVGFAEQKVPVGVIPLESHDLPLPRIVSA